jgi:hypothetical protein
MKIAVIALCLCTLSLTVIACGSPSTDVPAEGASVNQPDEATQRAFDQVMQYAQTQRLHERAFGEIVQEIGLQFQGKPYLAGLLDEGAEEVLVCRLDGFDCVTFVETALAMARGVAAEDYAYETFVTHMRDQRYRGGVMDGYCSRLHYFSEWLADNEERGRVHNITRELGGVALPKTLNFMSSHRESYARFATNDRVFACVREMEARLEGMQLFYIPQNRIRAAYSSLQAGDLIATATNIDGLDVTHTGLVYDGGDGRMGLLHASTREGVTVSPDLQSYIQNNRSQIGIIVARAIDVR